MSYIGKAPIFIYNQNYKQLLKCNPGDQIRTQYNDNKTKNCYIYAKTITLEPVSTTLIITNYYVRISVKCKININTFIKKKCMNFF